eukprot:3016128-Amphidinium_carterae.1
MRVGLEPCIEEGCGFLPIDLQALCGARTHLRVMLMNERKRHAQEILQKFASKEKANHICNSTKSCATFAMTLCVWAFSPQSQLQVLKTCILLDGLTPRLVAPALAFTARLICPENRCEVEIFSACWCTACSSMCRTTVAEGNSRR